MVKTVLIVVLMSLSNPNQPAKLLHKTYESEQACQSGFINMVSEIPMVPDVKVAAFCVSANDLADKYED